MPQLPGLEIARPQGVGRRADAADFGGQEAAALGQRGQVFNELGEASARIFEARQDARVSRAVAEAAVELQNQVDAFKDDSDLETQEERFGKHRDAVRKKYGEGLKGRWQGEYENRLFGASEAALRQVRDGVRTRAIDLGVADLNRTLDVYADLGGRAGLDERERVRGLAIDDLARATNSNLISARDAETQIGVLDARMMEAAVRASLRADPVATVAELKDHEGQFARLTEKRRQELIDEGEAEVKQQERFAKAEAAEREAKAEKAQREIERETEERGYFAAADGVMSVDWVQANRDRLSPGATRYFLGVAEKQEAMPVDVGEVYRLEVLRAQNPRAFAAEKIDPNKVGPRKAVEFIQSQSKARKDGVVATGMSFSGHLSLRLADMKGLSNAERVELFEIGSADLQAFTDNKGSKATPAEEKDIIDGVLMRRVQRTDGWLSFPDTLVRDVDAPIEIPEIPPKHVDEIAGALKRAGRPITPQSIREMYEQGKAAGFVK